MSPASNGRKNAQNQELTLTSSFLLYPASISPVPRLACFCFFHRTLSSAHPSTLVPPLLDFAALAAKRTVLDLTTGVCLTSPRIDPSVLSAWLPPLPPCRSVPPLGLVRLAIPAGSRTDLTALPLLS